MLVLGLRLCIAEAEVPAAAAAEAGHQSIGSEVDDEEYAVVTFEHRRSIEADYHAINCLAQQPQVSLRCYVLPRRVAHVGQAKAIPRNLLGEGCFLPSILSMPFLCYSLFFSFSSFPVAK